VLSTAGLAPLIGLLADHFLPEAVANAQACAEGRRMVNWARGGVTFRYRANSYRTWRLHRLSEQYATLPPGDQTRVKRLLGDAACQLLSRAPPWPTVSPDQHRTRDRWWRLA